MKPGHEAVFRVVGILSHQGSPVSMEQVIKTTRQVTGNTRHPANVEQSIRKSLTSLQGDLIEFEKSGWGLTEKGQELFRLFTPQGLPAPGKGDPYLQLLSLGLPCFSLGYESSSDICKQCAVAHECAAAHDLRRTVLAFELEQADKDKKKLLEKEMALLEKEREQRLLEAMEPTQSAPPAEPIESIISRLNKAPPSTQTPIPASFEEVEQVPDSIYCYHCKAKIKGRGRYREGTGYYHITCEQG